MTNGIFRVMLVVAVMSVFAASVVFGVDANAPVEPKPAMVTPAGNVVKIVKDEDKSVPKYEETKYNAKLKDYNYDAVVAGGGFAKPIDGNIGEFLVEDIKLTMKEKKFKSGAIETEELGKVRILFSPSLTSVGFIALLTDEQLTKLDKLVEQESKNVAPRRLSPVFEDRSGGIQVLATGPGGLALGFEFFAFDPVKKKSGPHSHSRFSSQMYGNCIVTSDRMGKLKRLQFGELVLKTTEENMAFVSFLFEEYKELSISSDYVVSPVKESQAKATPSAPIDPSVVIYFDSRLTDSSGGKDIPGILILRRNGAPLSSTPLKVPDTVSKLDFYQLAAVPLSKTGFPVCTIDRPRWTDDVVEWTVENDGKVTHTGKVSFPVLATVPNIVAYGVRIADHPKK